MDGRRLLGDRLDIIIRADIGMHYKDLFSQAESVDWLRLPPAPQHLTRKFHRFTATAADLPVLAALWRAILGPPPSGALRATESAPGGFVNAARVLAGTAACFASSLCTGKYACAP